MIKKTPAKKSPRRKNQTATHEQYFPTGRPQEMGPGITCPEMAATWLHVGETMITRWCREGRFECGKINDRSWWIGVESLIEFSKIPREPGNPEFVGKE